MALRHRQARSNGRKSKSRKEIPRSLRMLSKEDNESLTRVGPGTPMGELMRRYWIPAAFSHQICEARRPADARQADGREPGPVPRHAGARRAARRALSASHRLACSTAATRRTGCAASITAGNSTSTATASTCRACRRRTATCKATSGARQGLSLPGARRRGVDLYGPAGAASRNSPTSNGRAFRSPRYATRHIQECNWLQGLEGGFDTSHLTFLHGGADDRRARTTCPRATRWCRPISASSSAPAASQGSEIVWTVERDADAVPQDHLARSPARRPCLGADRRREHDALQRRLPSRRGR